MTRAPVRILVTGPPGVGKTTLVRSVLGRLGGRRAAGFYTEEIRGSTGRTGFKALTLDGREGRLATAARRGGGPRVGRYTVDLPAFEEVALRAIALRAGVDLYVVDEIGKMECLSPRFVEAVFGLLAAPVDVLATVALRGGGPIQRVKTAPGVELVEIDRGTRDRLATAIATRLS